MVKNAKGMEVFKNQNAEKNSHGSTYLKNTAKTRLHYPLRKENNKRLPPTLNSTQNNETNGIIIKEMD